MLAMNATTCSSLGKCFMIMPFQKDLTMYYQNIIKPAVNESGYEIKRADEIVGIRAFSDDIKDEIKSADFVIADSTYSNPNVTYEMGIADGSEKKVIRISQRLEDVISDCRHLRIILYNTEELGWEQKFKIALKEAIRAI